MINLDCAELDQGLDDELVPLADIANICCGAYAGNEEMMSNAVQICINKGVHICAHVGYPDRENFGRRTMVFSQPDLQKEIRSQINLLEGICRNFGERIQFVKCHGALYHDLNRHEGIAKLVVNLIRDVLPDIQGIISMGGQALNKYDDKDIKIIREGFADRNYTSELQLQSRAFEDAVYSSKDQIIKQYEDLKSGSIITGAGVRRLFVDTICFHGDNPASREALKCIRAVRD